MTKGLNADDLISTTTFLVDLRDFGVGLFDEPCCSVMDEFNSCWEQPENAFFNDQQINKVKNMSKNEYLKTKTDKVNTYVEFSGRQTGKTTRLIQRALLESYQNNVVIFVNGIDNVARLGNFINSKINQGINTDVNIGVNDISKTFFRFYNKLSNKKIIVICNFKTYLDRCFYGVNDNYSFFFEEAAFNSNLGFLSHKEILERIAPNGLLYFSTTLKTFLQKKNPVELDFHNNEIQFIYDNFGIDVNLKNKLPSNVDWVDEDQRRLEEGYLFKTVGQTTYE